MPFRWPDFRSRNWLRSPWMGLLLISVGTLVRATFYLPAAIPPGHKIPALETYLPSLSWAGLWAIIGGFGLICVVLRLGLAAAVGAITGLHILWGMLYLMAWVLHESQRGFVTAWSYFLIAALIIWAYGRTTYATVRVQVEERGCG